MRGPEAPSDHVTPYDRIALSDAQVESLLVSGEHAQELSAYFGEDEYRALTRLARAAAAARVRRDAGRTIIVPGIMGTQLGMPRRPPLPPDILWLDPVDIGAGRLTALTVAGGDGVIAYGAVLYSYLRLKLHLRAAGFAPLLHYYDWRRDVTLLGAELAARVQREDAAEVAVIGHSLGGLVGRAALAHPGGERVQRLVLLGTPNSGSCAAVQALRGTYPVVRKLARLDATHSAETLAAHVFSSFPSLYQMLPTPGRAGPLDLFDPSIWPRSGPQPSAELLALGRDTARRLPVPDERCVVIVGVGEETVTRLARRREDFVYTITRHGDGTVPTVCAELAGAHHYYARVSHSELTRDATIASAVIDLLRHGATARLAERWRSASRAFARIGDRELGRTQLPKVEWARLAPEERRLFLQNLNEPPKLRLRAPRAAQRAHRPKRPGPRRARRAGA